VAPACQAHGIAKQMSQALQEERPPFIVRVSISGLIIPILSKSEAILAKLWGVRQKGSEVALEILSLHA
jgi:hypothetical protein